MEQYVKLLLGCMALLPAITQAQNSDPNIEINMGGPTYGIRLKANFGNATSGWARGYKIANQDGSQNFITFGTYGSTSNGISSVEYSYIGRDFNDTFMSFLPNGNVGIGTNAVENSERWGKAFEVKGAESAKTIVTTANVRSGIWSHDSGFYGAPAGGIVGTHSNHPFSIITNMSAKLTVLTNGNVGIGTNAPAEKLSVNGKIRAHEVKVETANWADYVFADDYILPSLKETAQFIEKHKHLPNVPKGSTIEQNGLDLGEMNRILMEKVEELTLHLIEKDRELENQGKRLENLEKLLQINKNSK